MPAGTSTGSTDDDGDGADEVTEELAAVGLTVLERELEGAGLGVLSPHDIATNVAVTSSTSARLCMSRMLSAPT